MRDIAERASRTREERSFTVDGLEIREEGDTVAFDGIASTVDTAYTVRDSLGEFTETIAAGAFNRTVKQADDVRLLVNHQGVPLARTKSKTLTLRATPDLRATAPSLDPANPTVQEIRSALARKDIDQMSIGMRVRDDDWNDDYTERTIREIQLFDVSIVTFPANPTTSASIRSLDEAVKALTDAEAWDEATVRRAIAHLEAHLRGSEVREIVEDVAKREDLRAADAMHALWARRLPDLRAGMFMQDKRERLREALMERFPAPAGSYMWVRDFDDDTVVFDLEGGYAIVGTFELKYTVNGDALTLDAGDPVEVNPTISYVPA